MKSLGSLRNKSPVPFSTRYNTNINPFARRSSPEAQMRAYGSVGTLFAIVNRTSNAVSQVDWNLWQKAPSGRKEDRVEVTRHPALVVWNKPNDFYTRQELVEAFQQHVDLVGESNLVVARDSRFSLPIELWVVRPDRVEVKPDPQKFISDYEYITPDGGRINLGVKNVIQLKMPNPLDPYRGLGPVQSILTDLDSHRYSAEWNRNFFLNSAEPGGIIKLDKRLTDPEFKQLRMRWNEQHKGLTNSHRVAILEQGEWVDRKFTMRDMQFAELRNISRDVIQEAFGFPKSLLGLTENVNRANAEAAEVMFSRWLVVPRLERIKQALNNDFLPLFGTSSQNLEFDYRNPVPEDVELEARMLSARADSATKLVAAGWNAEDVLKAVGLPEMSFGSQTTGGV